MRKLIIGLLSMLFIATACNGQTGEKEQEVVLETTLGEIRIKLYNDTPIHRDNFLKNVREGKYDGCTWHRIIRSFMVQTGEQPSDRDKDTTFVDSANWLPAEIHFPQHYHKRGVVAAAREDDGVNPQKKSDPHQFYIVTGRNYNEDGLIELDEINKAKAAERLFNKKVEAKKAELEALRAAREMDKLSDALEKLLNDAEYEVSENPPAPYNKEQRRSYRTYGGAPWLDGEYTIFGEVVEGMKTVLALEKVKTDDNDRPLSDVKVIRAYVVE